MVNAITAAGGNPELSRLISKPPLLPTELSAGGNRDVVEFGQGGRVSTEQAQGIVLDRAYEQLRAVVDGARSELGIPEGAVLDTSPEATANRIADFALGFFGKYAENNGLENNEEGRGAFVKFIGAAIDAGIGEARGILDALQSLSPEVGSNIDKTASIIQQRLDDFVANGLGNKASIA